MQPSISLIGAGNLANHLAPALENCGFIFNEVYSRTLQNAKKLVSNLYEAEVTSTLDFSNSNSTIFIIAVPDDAIEDVSREIVLPDDAILVHTSGNTSMDVLDFSAANHVGVFYPLQTFTRGKEVEFKEIPILVEGSDSETSRILTEVGRSLSKSVHQINSDQRKRIHLSAVFASNFVNHLLTISAEIVQKQKVDFEILHPLIIEQINKSLTVGPEHAQTGPALREDLKTLDSHVDILNSEYNEDLAEIYRVISQNIIDHYS